jgi:hypothetical protein
MREYLAWLAWQAYMGLFAKLHMTFAGFRLQFVTKTYGSLRFGRDLLLVDNGIFPLSGHREAILPSGDKF